MHEELAKAWKTTTAEREAKALLHARLQELAQAAWKDYLAACAAEDDAWRRLQDTWHPSKEKAA